MLNKIYFNVVSNAPYIFIALFLFSLIYFNYHPTWDESFQIEAANRLLINKSYDSSWVIPKDLSKPTFQFLTAWPAGYSILIWAFLNFGLTLKFTLIVIKIIFVVFNFFIWSKASEYFLINNRSKYYFKIIFSFVVIVDSISTTEIILMGIFGWITFIIFDRNIKKNKFYLYLGILLSVAFIFKYTAVLLIFSTIVYLFLEFNWTKDLKNVLFNFLSPIIVVIATIFFTNYFYSSNVSTITNFNNFSKFHFVSNINLFQLTTTVFLKSVQIPILVKKGLIYYFEYYVNNFACVLLIIPLLLVLSKKIVVKNFKYIVVVFSSAIFLLFLISMLFFTDPFRWYPLMEARYYVPFSPLLLIFYSHVITFYNRNEFLNKLIFCVTVLFICSFVVIYISKKNKYSFEIENNISKIERFINNDSLDRNRIVFLDKFYFPLLIRNGKYNSFYFHDSYDRISLNVKNDIYVYIVASKNSKFSKNKYESSVEMNNINNFSMRNNFTRTDVSSDVVIFSKLLKK